MSTGKQADNKQKATKSCSWPAMILSLAALVIASTTGYFQWQLQQTLTDSLTKVNTAEKNITSLQTNSKQQLQSQKDAQHQLSALIQQAPHKRLDWQVITVVQSLRQANYLLQVQNNTDAAIALINFTEQQLNKLPNQYQQPLLSQVKDVKQKIEALPKDSQQQLISQLQQVKQSIKQLTVLTPTHTTSIKQRKKDDASKLEKAANQGWQHLQKLIVIRHHQQSLSPLMTSKQQQLLKQHLLLLLQQATIATINHDNNLYQTALSEFASLLQNYYQDASGIAPILDQVSKLKQHDITLQLPKLDQLITDAEKLQQTALTAQGDA